FNIILFGENVVKFSSDLQVVTSRSIEALEKWFSRTKFSSLSYALPGLLSAAANDDMCSIYFITDGFSNDNEYQLQCEIKRISACHNFSIFLIADQLPPDEKSFVMFRCLAVNNPEVWGAITLITTKRQAKILKLTKTSLSTTDTNSISL
ncbi:unnamed protein product, partial [Hymenolepis diminuta]